MQVASLFLFCFDARRISLFRHVTFCCNLSVPTEFGNVKDIWKDFQLVGGLTNRQYRCLRVDVNHAIVDVRTRVSLRLIYCKYCKFDTNFTIIPLPFRVPERLIMINELRGVSF